MMKRLKLLPIYLTLFDSGAAVSPAVQDAPAPAPPPAPTSGKKDKTQSGTVHYGKTVSTSAQTLQTQQPSTNASNSETPATSDTLEARRAEFQKIVSGEYKDLYDEAVQSATRRHAADSQALGKRLADASRVCELLAGKYGVTADDPAVIAAAIEKDDAYWSDAAEDAGMSVEQYREYARMERENAQFRKMAEQQGRERFANETLQRWKTQAQGMAADYPDFDFERECAKNPQFSSLLQNNIDVRTAFEVTHMDDIKQRTAQNAQRNVTETIRAKGMRPAENGAAAAGGVLVKSDVSKLTRADRAEIARRAARGERITF